MFPFLFSFIKKNFQETSVCPVGEFGQELEDEIPVSPVYDVKTPGKELKGDTPVLSVYTVKESEETLEN